ncbi:unnamed protein product [Prunus armeniaca]
MDVAHSLRSPSAPIQSSSYSLCDAFSTQPSTGASDALGTQPSTGAAAHAQSHCLATRKLCVASNTFVPGHIALRHASFVLPSAPPCLAASLCDRQALCCLRHLRAQSHCLATRELCVAFGTPVPSHIALRHASFVLPPAPSCPATLPCNMQALCCLRHPPCLAASLCDTQALCCFRHLRAQPHCLATRELCVAFGTPVPSHIALRHASFVLPPAPSCLATLPCDMRALCCLRHPPCLAASLCDTQALCYLRHLRARPHCLATCKLCVASSTIVPSHVALRQASFVLPPAPSCLITSPCDMRALYRLRHHRA